VTTSSTTTAVEAALLTASAADAATLAVANAAAAALSLATTDSGNTGSTGTLANNTAPIIPAGAVSKLMDNVTNYQYNPASIQTAILQTLTDVTDGKINIVDPSNPFVFCLEAASVLTAAFMIKNEVSTRKQYPYAAQTPEDLYLHMSDIDYINRFAVPTTTTFNILLPLNEVLNKMVLDTNTGIKKIVIPRNTYFTIANVPFSIQYPIEIRQMQHGGLQVVYDTSVTSPLQTLASNVIRHEIRQSTGGKYIFFEFETIQFNIVTQTASLNSMVDFSAVINFTDQYYYTRVYAENANGTWTEIRTTHSDEIYDIAVPTAVVKIIDNSVRVSIPQIYTASGILNRGLRIDVYETKGPLNMILWEYPFTSFIAKWLAIDPNDNTIFVAPLSTFNTIIPFSTSVVSGGKDGTNFADLRRQVMTNAIGRPSLPITNAQIENTLNIAGYTIVKSVDNVTSRIFLATKGMPIPNEVTLITPASAGMSTINITIDQLVQIDTVIDNSAEGAGQSVTITPDTIYQNVNGVTTPLTTNQLNTLLTQSNQSLAFNVNNNNYLYTPFHYVLDMSNNEFSVRAYYLDKPTIVTQLFVETNDTTLLQVNTGTYSIYRTATGYTLTVVTLSNDTYKELLNDEVGAQLSYIPVGQTTPAYLNGVLMGSTDLGERIFSFDLSTNFNVDISDNIMLSKFLMFANQPVLTATKLTTDFNIIYNTNSQMSNTWISSGVDDSLGKFLLDNNVIGITNEILRINFGYSLARLWNGARSILSTAEYQKRETDALRLYEEDIYLTDENGSVVQFDENGNPVLTLLHSKGDIVMDSTGEPIYRYRTGDVVLDSVGNPIVVNARTTMHQFDVMLIEGAYWFANDIVANRYRTLITQNLLDWITNDLVGIENQLLEQTNIYFYPNTTLGTIRAVVDNNITVNIDASQTFDVNLYVSKVVYDNVALRSQLTNATISTIGNELTKTTFSIDSITTSLRGAFGNDVISIQVKGLGGNNNYSVVTILDTGKNCSIKKRLVAMPDNSLVINEQVNVLFILYNTPS